MAVELSHLVDCPECGATFDGRWLDDSDTAQDMAEPPTADQECPACKHVFPATYEGWTEWSGAG